MLAAMGQGNIQRGGGGDRIVEKQFVKIAHAIKQSASDALLMAKYCCAIIGVGLSPMAGLAAFAAVFRAGSGSGHGL